MSPSLVRQVARSSVGLLIVALLVAGSVTGGLLYWRAVEAGDQALLAAAHAYGGRTWEAEHSTAPVEVHLVSRASLGLATPTHEGVDERPRLATRHGLRELWLPVEVEAGDEGRDKHAVVVARAPAVTLRSSVGPFALFYGLASLLVAAAVGLLQIGRVRRAVAPLERARQDVGRVVAAGQGARVQVQGPAEVQALLVDVNALLGRLDAAFASQARFTAEAAHELRTPVAVLRGEVDLALRRPRSPAELAATLRSVSEEVSRLAALVDGLMVMARIDTGQVDQDRVEVPVAALVMAAIRQEGAAIEAGGGRLDVDLGQAGAALLAVNEALAVAALANLLRNAATYAPGAAVAIGARVLPQAIELWVDDAGPGIPSAEREAVFDRLQRGARDRAVASGLGLGLALAREVARRHGGDCRAEDSALGGARLVLTLPLSADSLPQSAEAQPPSVEPGSMAS